MVKQINENQIIGYAYIWGYYRSYSSSKLAAWSDVARKIAHEIKNLLHQ